ncbi:MAG: hypothetical protein JW699_00400 [Chitinispirillaceae bacterium]|nr:hypothetical protein [Chitinispirillaceae bacterium]
MNSIVNTIKGFDTVRCFVLRGQDTVSRERARESIVAALEKEGGPCVREPFDPSAVESSALFVQRMLTPSLFQERRVFIFRHTREIRQAGLEELDAALSGLAEGVYCIIDLEPPVKKDDAERVEGGGKEAKRVIEGLHIAERIAAQPPTACLLEFEKPRDYQIAGWLVDNAPVLIGRRIAPADAEYMVERVGSDLDTLNSELQKIDLYCAPGAPVTRAVIDHIAGNVRQATPFELAAALGRRDFPRAIRIIEMLFSFTISLPYVVSAIGRHFWTLFRIKKFLAVNPDIGRRFAASKGYKNAVQTETGLAIGKAAGILRDGEERRIYPALVKSGIVEQARSFSDDELAAILSWLVEFDTGIKTGMVEQTKSSLQTLCYRIVRARLVLEEGAGGR